jgi:hypothetical protein
MPSKAIVIGFGLVITIAFVVSLVEFFVPLTAKIHMNACCRNALLRMETEGGLTQENSDDLVEKLCRKGFSDIMVSGTARALRGETLFLRVRANYVYTRMTGFFRRDEVSQAMEYERISAARKVVN